MSAFGCVFVSGSMHAEGTGKVGKMRHKLMVVDDSVTIAGSFNYTKPANLFNDENIIVLGDDENPSQNQKILARAASAEIDRIIESHAKPVRIKIDQATGKKVAF